MLYGAKVAVCSKINTKKNNKYNVGRAYSC